MAAGWASKTKFRISNFEFRILCYIEVLPDFKIQNSKLVIATEGSYGG